MGDGWTGIDIGAVETQLDNFVEAMYDINSYYYATAREFANSLYRTWASEKAVEFNSKLEEIEHLEDTMVICHNKILASATKAANFMASYNGAEFNYDYVIWVLGDLKVQHLEAEKDGIKGMNVTLAKFALDTFNEKMKNIVNALDTLPMDFSLLDPAGELQAEYVALVKSAKENVQATAESVSAELTAAFETEEKNILLGKTQAETELAA